MINPVFRYGIQMVGLVLLQGLVLNNIHVFGMATTYFYVAFLLFLPIEYNRILVLLLGFILGLSIDCFGSSWGLHTFSSVFIAYLRPTIFRFLSPRDGYEFNAIPNWSFMGFRWFIAYASIAVFIHHFIVLLVEAFRMSEFLTVLGRAFASTTFTIILLVITQLFAYKSNRST